MALERKSEDAMLASGSDALEGTPTEQTEGLLGKFPCGVLRCTYEKHPKAVYANDWMFRLLGTDSDSEDWKEFIQQNIFFMIPFEDRDLFKRDLQRAAESDEPVAVEHWVRNCSGGKSRLMGWIRTAETMAGEREYVFLYLPVSEMCMAVQNEREAAYETVLEGVFDAVFRIDWGTRMVECIHAKPNIQLPNMPGIHMICDDAVREEFLNLVCAEDRARVESFFNKRSEKPWVETQKRRSYQIDFRVTQADTIKEMLIVAVDLVEQATLFCCREITHERYVQHIAEEMEFIRRINLDISHGQRGYPVKSTTYRLAENCVYLQSGG